MKNRELKFTPLVSNEDNVRAFNSRPIVFYCRYKKDLGEHEICRDRLDKWFVLPDDITAPITFVFSERKHPQSYRLGTKKVKNFWEGSTCTVLTVNETEVHELEVGAERLALNAVRKGYKYVRLEY
ncbi:MAG: hypothetical protein ACYSTI_13205 [Planctomycetota bacterium]|jgi:hypothetical protein